jgi:hypothetical protein
VSSQKAVLWFWICTSLPGLRELLVDDDDRGFKYPVSETWVFKDTLRDYRVHGAPLEAKEILLVSELCPHLRVLNAACPSDSARDTTKKLLEQNHQLSEVYLGEEMENDREFLTLMNTNQVEGRLFAENSTCPPGLLPLVFAHAYDSTFHSKLIRYPAEYERLMDRWTAVFWLLQRRLDLIWPREAE